MAWCGTQLMTWWVRHRAERAIISTNSLILKILLWWIRFWGPYGLFNLASWGLVPISGADFTINTWTTGRTALQGEVWMQGQKLGYCAGVEARNAAGIPPPEHTEKGSPQTLSAHYGTIREAITHLRQTWQGQQARQSPQFYRKVNQHQNYCVPNSIVKISVVYFVLLPPLFCKYAG